MRHDSGHYKIQGVFLSDERKYVMIKRLKLRETLAVSPKPVFIQEIVNG